MKVNLLEFAVLNTISQKLKSLFGVQLSATKSVALSGANRLNPTFHFLELIDKAMERTSAIADEAQRNTELGVLEIIFNSLPSELEAKDKEIRRLIILAQMLVEESTVAQTRESFATFAEKLQASG